MHAWYFQGLRVLLFASGFACVLVWGRICKAGLMWEREGTGLELVAVILIVGK